VPRWTFTGTVLPGGATAQLVAGTGGTEPLPGRFALPGLVDAHCHLTVATDEQGPYLGDAVLASERLRALARSGVTVVRDVGGRREITLPLGTDRSTGQPQILAAGRFFAPAHRYFPRMHAPVDPTDLLAEVEREMDDGAQWIKLIGDFPAVDGDGALVRDSTDVTYHPTLVREVVEAAHRRGARVAVHTNSTVVSALIAAGIDSVEHGGALTPDDITALGARGGAWTPTLEAAIGTVPPGAAARSGWRAARSQELSELLPWAVQQGVRVLAGSDVVGAVHREVALLVEHGLSAELALRAATGEARGYLGLGEDGDVGDLVTYDRDPREDLAVLAAPAAVVIRGHRIR
jgi:imidazolonepropionase-like amidohydrolase